MHAIDLLAAALAEARRLGYEVRHEWLGGSGGGACEVRGRKWLFLDLAQTPDEQLDVVRDVFREQRDETILKMPPPLVAELKLRKAA